MEEDKMDDYESHESEKLPDEDELLQYLNELQTSIREFKEAITGEILKKGQLVKKSTWVNSKDAAGFLQVTGRTLAAYRKRRLIHTGNYSRLVFTITMTCSNSEIL